MPLYTYRCDNCGVQFEQRRRFDEAALEKCPECRKKALRKVYLPIGILFKGPGFYSTDHRSGSGSNGQSSRKDEKQSESGEKSSKSDKVPAKEKASENKNDSDD